ncbi:MAG: VWA domain-containing protein, partial [Ruminococcaceae bacterium]|nr:VWA domain-containing protein [Oscillospiraceae bacterium]
MAKKSKTRKVFSKVLSVILCVTILGTTYAGFFGGMDAAAGAVDTLTAGEVGLTKDVVQNGRGADVIVQTAAMPVEITSTNTEVIEQVVDVVLIVDTSGSMGASYGNLIDSAKTAAKDLANTVYSMNSQNRIALGSFAQYAYAYNKSSTSGVEYSKVDTNAGAGTYFFGASEQATLNKRIESLSAVGGTNSEGGLLVAEKLVQVSDPERKKLVIFLTDGLPTGRYKDNGTKLNTVATYDGNGSGIPNYAELSEMVSVAERINADGNTQMATIFYTGGLETNDSITQYYKGCTSSSCSCNTASRNHGGTALKAPGTAGLSTEQAYMAPFYRKTSYQCAEHIVNNLLAPNCEAGVYMPENASEMLDAFKDIVNNYVVSNLYKAASNAYYEDIVPDYAAVVPATLQATTGTVELLEDQWVELNGENVQRDVVRWTIGDIPSEIQTLSYSIKVKDERDYGIMDTSVQGILRYDTCQYTQTPSPLITQIDEIILAPKGDDDYYVVEQEKNLEANVKINDDILNHLIDTSGNNEDATTLVNGYPAGLEGDTSAAHLAGYTTQIVSQPAWGSVILNDDGTFTYVQNADLYTNEVRNLAADSNGTDEYNAVTSGWEDTFTYKLVTDGWANKYTKNTTTT